MNVAVVGVGNMGAPMAACIARAGHSVTVFDSSPEQALQGGRRARLPRRSETRGAGGARISS